MPLRTALAVPTATAGLLLLFERSNILMKESNIILKASGEGFIGRQHKRQRSPTCS
jgi:hypothetical protein